MAEQTTPQKNEVHGARYVVRSAEGTRARLSGTRSSNELAQASKAYADSARAYAQRVAKSGREAASSR